MSRRPDNRCTGHESALSAAWTVKKNNNKKNAVLLQRKQKMHLKRGESIEWVG